MSLDGFKLVREVLGIPRINLTLYFAEMIILYPLLGYWIDNFWDQSEHFRRHTALLGLTSMLGMAVAMFMTLRENRLSQTWTENWIVFYSTGIAAFTFIVIRIIGYRLSTCMSERPIRILGFVSGTMFGIYLLENILRRLYGRRQSHVFGMETDLIFQLE